MLISIAQSRNSTYLCIEEIYEEVGESVSGIATGDETTTMAYQ